MNRVEFINSQRKVKVTKEIKETIINCINTVAEYEKLEHNINVDVMFVSNDGIKKINKEHRQKNTVTDVLSFPCVDFINGICNQEIEKSDFDLDGTLMLGDIVISLQRAQAQAQEYGHSFLREVGFLCVHSMFHLLGYDHERSDTDTLIMRDKEEKVLTKLELVR